jgi:hypothetical protein
MNKYPNDLIPANCPPDMCKILGFLNASQGWGRLLNSRWTDEQTRAYNEGYNEGKESAK